MSDLSRHILQAAADLPEGGLLSPKDFLHLGTRAAVDQNFTRIVRSGELLRIARGLYTRPEEGRFGKRAPSAETVLASLSAMSGETIVAHGAAAANNLGLSMQVPMQEVFLTSGPSRTINLGKRKIMLRHAPHWLLLLENSPGGRLIRALAWLGEQQAAMALAQLSDKALHSEWVAVAAVRAQLPDWMARMAGSAVRHA
jgi:hypothetical protein